METIDRASFVKQSLGQRHHHLSLWYLADTMGVLKNVLNMLSPEVATDTKNIPSDTVLTQRQWGKTGQNVEDDGDDRWAQKKRFQEGVTASLKNIGDGLKDANTIARASVVNQAIELTRSAIRAEEDKIHAFKLKSLLCTPEENDLYEGLIAHHGGRVAEYEDELSKLLKQRDAHGVLG